MRKSEVRGIRRLLAAAAATIVGLAFAACAVTAWAQEAKTVYLKGTIADQLGAALPGVTIIVKVKDCSCKDCPLPGCKCCPESRSITSDSSGKYEFRLPAGKYEVSADVAGFSTVKETVTLTLSSSAEANLRVKK